jgi:DNA-binding XRE family transcriptional regulator
MEVKMDKTRDKTRDKAQDRELTMRELKHALVRMGMNMSQLANALGCHTQSIYQAAKGSGDRPKVLAKIKAYLAKHDREAVAAK